MQYLESPDDGIVFYDYRDRSRPAPAPPVSVADRLRRAAATDTLARRRAWVKSLEPAETTATLMLGGTAFTLGGIVLWATVMGIAGQSLADWNESYMLMIEGVPSAGRPGGLRQVFAPTARCLTLAWPGMALGLAGVWLSRRRRRMSWFSAAGFLCCVGSIWAFALYEIWMNIS